MTGRDERDRVLIWDLPLRLFHWLIALCFAGSWLTQQLGVEWFPWHVRIGYLTLVLVAFRIAWGFVGPRHARFSNFLRGPGAVIGYLRKLRRGEAVTAAGHNPLGGLSIVAMLLLLAVQATTGLFANDKIFNTGPLYGYVSGSQSDRLSAWHEINFDCLLALVGLHLVAVVYYQWIRHVDLLGPMISGRVPAWRAPPGAAISGHRLWLAAVLVAIAATILWRVVATAPQAAMSLF